METAVAKKYILNQDTKFRFITTVLMSEIINYQTYFPVNLEDNDIFLLDYLKYMESHGLIEVNKDVYIPTEKGRTFLQSSFDKFFEFTKVFDIYCAVDLSKGEFAFSRFNEGMEDTAWKKFVDQPRFTDCRVAVAEFKKINPVEIVFLTFLNEGRFSVEVDNWQYKLTKDDVWNEIIDICNTAVSMEYLSKDGVIDNVIEQGSALMKKLLKEELDMKEAEAKRPKTVEEEYQTVTVEDVTVNVEYVPIVEFPCWDYYYFTPYYDDIYYVSPIWSAPLFW
jgi:hypothetical protein